MTTDGIDDRVRRERERVLTLDFACLRSIQGGINEVRLWWDPILECERVGKRLDISGVEGDDALPEPSTLQSIAHENIVSVISAAEVAGFPKPLHVIELITPFFPRGSVTDALLNGEQFTPSQAIAIVQAALRGLGHLHEVHSILHRDIKSGNILLTAGPEAAKLADLGLAGRMDPHGAARAVNNPTLYSPPEMRDGELTRASEIFSMNLVLRELISGAFPYVEYTTEYVTECISQGRSPVRKKDLVLPVWTPRDLRRVLAKASQQNPNDRYQSARAMDDQLARAKIADWREVEAGVWESPFVHRPSTRIRIESTPRRSGQLCLSTKVKRRTKWRRTQADVDVVDLRSAQAAAVFDQATLLSQAR